jgi:hypothetical protein
MLAERAAADSSMSRIHIVGCSPRSGTTLMMEMIAACCKVDFAVAHEQSIYDGPDHAGKVFLSKKPHDILWAEAVLRRMSDLYVIYMLRDPRDVVVSKHDHDPSHYWVGLNFWKNYTPLAKRIEDHPRLVVVRYEELVTDPSSIQRLLAKRFPFLRQAAAFAEFHLYARPSEAADKALGGVRSVSTASIGRWKKHLPRLTRQLQQHGSISHALIEWGYEMDCQWEMQLKTVEPDTSESHHPDAWALEDILRSYVSRFLPADQEMRMQLAGDRSYLLAIAGDMEAAIS